LHGSEQSIREREYLLQGSVDAVRDIGGGQDGVEPGDPVRVKLDAVDPVARTIEFSRIG